MVEFQNHSVRILRKGTPVAEDGQYVALPHNTEYEIELRNNTSQRNAAEIFVDGRSIGRFAVSSHNSIIIERHSEIARKLTFYKVGSLEACAAGLSSDNEDLGLITVVFEPEKVQQRVYAQLDSLIEEITRSSKGATFGVSFNAGGTGLGAPSAQQFTSTSFPTDMAKAVRIELRLEAAPDIIPIPFSTPHPSRRV